MIFCRVWLLVELLDEISRVLLADRVLVEPLRQPGDARGLLVLLPEEAVRLEGERVERVLL